MVFAFALATQVLAKAFFDKYDNPGELVVTVGSKRIIAQPTFGQFGGDCLSNNARS